GLEPGRFCEEGLVLAGGYLDLALLEGELDLERLVAGLALDLPGVARLAGQFEDADGRLDGLALYGVAIDPVLLDRDVFGGQDLAVQLRLEAGAGHVAELFVLGDGHLDFLAVGFVRPGGPDLQGEVFGGPG